MHFSSANVENDEETSIIAGIVWKVAEGFTVSPNIVQTKVGNESEDEFVLNFQMKFCYVRKDKTRMKKKLNN